MRERQRKIRRVQLGLELGLELGLGPVSAREVGLGGMVQAPAHIVQLFTNVIPRGVLPSRLERVLFLDLVVRNTQG